MKIDRNSLATKYATMEDEELLELHSSGSLIELAFEILETELAGRGLTIPEHIESDSYIESIDSSNIHDSNNNKIGTKRNELKGLGGWLFLVGIGVVLSPIILLVTFFPIYLPIFSDGIWEVLTTAGSEAYHPLWGPLLIVEIIYNIGMIAASIYLIYLYFSKHYLFPKFYIVLAVVSLIFIPLDGWLLKFILPDEPIFDAETSKNFFGALFTVCIWVPYMLSSERVKATFVEKIPNEEMYPTRPLLPRT